MRFRLLHGKHQSGTGRHGNDGLRDYAAHRNGKPRTDPGTGEELPNVIETTIDLASMFGSDNLNVYPMNLLVRKDRDYDTRI